MRKSTGGSTAPVGDDAGKFARAWRLAEQQRFVLSLVLNPPKGTTVLRIRDFSRRGARQVHEATLRNGQPFALRLVLDRDRLGCYFVRNGARIKFRLHAIDVTRCTRLTA